MSNLLVARVFGSDGMLEHKTTAAYEGDVRSVLEKLEALCTLCDVKGKASHAPQQHLNRRGGINGKEVTIWGKYGCPSKVPYCWVGVGDGCSSCPAEQGQRHASGSLAFLWRSRGAQGERGSAGCHTEVQKALGFQSRAFEE